MKCYWVQYVVDCLITNHTALRKSVWRTQVEKMFGHTPLIGMFCYVFWEPVLHFEPVATCPKTKILPGRFTGIAWDQRDAFTYRIWSEPEGDWTRGCALIPNVVKPKDKGCKEQSEPSQPPAEAPILNFSYRRKQNLGIWKMANRKLRICRGS